MTVIVNQKLYPENFKIKKTMVLFIIVILAIYGLIAGVLHYLVWDGELNETEDYFKAFFTPILVILISLITIVGSPFLFGRWAAKKLDEKFDFKK